MPVIAADADSGRWLLCRIAKRLCALPAECVLETMRPLPVEPIAQSQSFVLGLSLIRGSPVPVVDAAAMLDGAAGRPGRFVTMQVGGRCVALAVDGVIGLRSLGADFGAALPPLLKDSASDVVAAVGTLDAELLLLLHAARAAPETLLEHVGSEGPVS
jgi:purine-binding chemotaxis protein CheW